MSDYKSELREALELLKNMGSLTKELEMLREQVKELRVDRDHWRRMALAKLDGDSPR